MRKPPLRTKPTHLFQKLLRPAEKIFGGIRRAIGRVLGYKLPTTMLTEDEPTKIFYTNVKSTTTHRTLSDKIDRSAHG